MCLWTSVVWVCYIGYKLNRRDWQHKKVQIFFMVHVWDIFYIAEQFSLLNIEDLGRPAPGPQMEISSLVIIFTFNMFVTLMSINTRCSCWIDLIIFFFKTTDSLCYHFMFPFLNTFMLFSFHSASFFWNHSWVFKEKQVSRRDLGFSFFPSISEWLIFPNTEDLWRNFDIGPMDFRSMTVHPRPQPPCSRESAPSSPVCVPGGDEEWLAGCQHALAVGKFPNRRW